MPKYRVAQILNTSRHIGESALTELRKAGIDISPIDERQEISAEEYEILAQEREREEDDMPPFELPKYDSDGIPIEEDYETSSESEEISHPEIQVSDQIYRTKHIFVVRHGDYDGLTGALKPGAEKEIDELAKILKEITGEVKNVYLGSSPYLRAYQTAKRIASAFQIPDFGIHSALGDQGSSLRQEDCEALHKIVQLKLKEYDAIILSTHLATTNSYPYYFGAAEFGENLARKQMYEYPEAERGKAIYINLEARIVCLAEKPKNSEPVLNPPTNSQQQLIF